MKNNPLPEKPFKVFTFVQAPDGTGWNVLRLTLKKGKEAYYVLSTEVIHEALFRREALNHLQLELDRYFRAVVREPREDLN